MRLHLCVRLCVCMCVRLCVRARVCRWVGVCVRTRMDLSHLLHVERVPHAPSVVLSAQVCERAFVYVRQTYQQTESFPILRIEKGAGESTLPEGGLKFSSRVFDSPSKKSAWIHNGSGTKNSIGGQSNHLKESTIRLASSEIRNCLIRK